MRQRIHFLSGLPRTGSTLLASILNQNPHVYASPTSPLYPLMVGTNATLNALAVQHTFDQEAVGDRIYPHLAAALYPANRNRPVIFDKHRGWPRAVESIRRFVDSDPKIIATVRPVPEIITSYITLADRDPNNFIDRELNAAGIPITNESRAMHLWTQHLANDDGPWTCLREGLLSHPESILLVDYDRLCYSPRDVLRDIYSFAGLDAFQHDFGSIEDSEETNDEAWGMAGLHRIRPRLCKVSHDPLAVLPQAAIDWFSQFDISGVMV